MSVQNQHQASWSQSETPADAHAWANAASDFILVAEGKPPSRIELARERMLICRLYLGLLRTITDDYGTEFAAHSDSLASEPSASMSSCARSCAHPFAQVRSRTPSNCHAWRC